MKTYLKLFLCLFFVVPIADEPKKKSNKKKNQRFSEDICKNEMKQTNKNLLFDWHNVIEWGIHIFVCVFPSSVYR